MLKRQRNSYSIGQKKPLLPMLFNMEEMKQPDISNLIKLWLDAGLSQVKLERMKQTIKVCEWVLVERLFILKPKKNYTIGF